MIDSYIESLKLASPLILTTPSNSTLPASLQPVEKPFNQTCVANQLSGFYNSRKIAETTKVSNGKVRKTLIKANTDCKNIQKPSEG